MTGCCAGFWDNQGTIDWQTPLLAEDQHRISLQRKLIDLPLTDAVPDGRAPGHVKHDSGWGATCAFVAAAFMLSVVNTT